MTATLEKPKRAKDPEHVNGFKRAKKPKRAKNNRHIAPYIGVAAAILVVGTVIMSFVINRWSVELTIQGTENMAVEYGEAYQDPGAQAFFHGSLLFKRGWPIKVVTEGNVNASKTGIYTISYTAELLNWKASETRTVTVEDTQPPEITLTEIPGSYTLPNAEYQEEGFSAVDNYDGDLTDQVKRTVKEGTVYYTVTDSSGNEAEVTRKIKYDDPIPPELHLLGDSEITLNAGTDYSEAGWEATDNCDGDLTEAVQVEGSVDIYRAGTYELQYSVTDTYGNVASAKRTVTVQPVRQPDTVTPSGKTIYLTFDDGPGKYTQKLLDVLEQYNVKVTFFTVNTGYTSLIAKEVAAGHSVGMHSASHNYSKIYASEEAYFEDLYQMQDVIYQQAGIRPTIMRFPGGSSNTVSRFTPGIMTTLTQDVTDLGFQYFDWNVLSGDAGETTDTETVFQNVIQGVQKQDVSIVLQHDIHGFSVDAVEKIIAWGLANGYTFLPLEPSSPTAHQQVNN